MQLVFPVSKKGERIPKISDGWHIRSSGIFHSGVDIMYRRLPNEPIIKPWGTQNYIMFPDTPVLAAHDGVVKRAERIGTGGFVYIQGQNIETKYMHLTKILVAPGAYVKAGTILGTVGENPKDPVDPSHLHFELYDGGEKVNPEPYLKGARYLSKMITSVVLLLVGGLGIYLLIKKGVFKW